MHLYQSEKGLIDMNNNNETIVEMATLQLKIDQGQPSTNDVHTYEQGLAGLSSGDFIVMNLAVKVLEGKQYSVTTDNAETVKRCRSLADHMGALVQEIFEGSGLTKIVFRPSSRQ